MKLIAQENFSWAHDGVRVEEFEEGDVIQTEDDDLITVSTSEGWAKPAEGEAPMPVRRSRAKQ
jgi:hypothetical protein